MRISLNWLKKYVKVSVPDEELVRLIGARLVEVEDVIDERTKYDKIYVVKVVQAEKIPETHLTLCQVDDGSGELTQVVCGAPNVREGMLAVWLKPGAVVPASVHEDAPFLIGKRKMLKQYESNGMLAGADELDFDDRHERIAEIDPMVAQPGDLLADVFDLKDQILDIENKSLTHRPDCFGVIGFAREVAGILGQKFCEPEIANGLEGVGGLREAKSVSGEKVGIAISDPKICPRYSAVVLEKHGALEDRYLTQEQIWLAKAGMRTVSPIVDATNYLMLLTGQPLHAFDYDKFVAVGGTKQPEIRVRLAKEGEKLVLLDDKEIVLTGDDIVIASGETPVALAGAMGGKATEIDAETRKILIESATFSLYNLRKTQMVHGIFSEAITRFTKGQPTYQTMKVALECTEMLKEGFKLTAMGDEGDKGESEKAIEVMVGEINDLLGTDYTAEKIIRTLENVGMAVERKPGRNGAEREKDASTMKVDERLRVVVPAWRTDLRIREDIIEEVGRLLGYDNITPVLPLHQTAEKNERLRMKQAIREALCGWGANEVLSYSFVSGKLLEKVGLVAENSYKIVNSISPELQYVRQSIVPSLLEKAYLNQKIPFDKFALFEMNKVYQKKWGMDAENVPVEKERLGFVLAERKGVGTAYYKARKFVERLLERLGITAEFRPLQVGKMVEARTTEVVEARSVRTTRAAKVVEMRTTKVAKASPLQAGEAAEVLPFEPKRAAEIVTESGEILGVVGEFRNVVRNEFKLAPFLAGFELDLEKLLMTQKMKKEIYLGEIEKRDLTISTEKNYAEILAEIRRVLAKYNVTVKISPIGIYRPEGEKKKNVSVHLEFRGKIHERVMEELESIVA